MNLLTLTYQFIIIYQLGWLTHTRKKKNEDIVKTYLNTFTSVFTWVCFFAVHFNVGKCLFRFIGIRIRVRVTILDLRVTGGTWILITWRLWSNISEAYLWIIGILGDYIIEKEKTTKCKKLANLFAVHGAPNPKLFDLSVFVPHTNNAVLWRIGGRVAH